MLSNEFIFQIQKANDLLHVFSDSCADENYTDANSETKKVTWIILK